MWTYRQQTGVLLDAKGACAATGYSGHGDGLNNPAMQQVRDVGPIPQGIYSLGAPFNHPKCGEFAIPLIPHAANQMFGRDDFYIHGDLIGHVGEDLASDGCIILPLEVREGVWRSGDRVLEVTA